MYINNYIEKYIHIIKSYPPFNLTYRTIYLEYICQQMDQYTWGNWFIYDPRHNRDNQSKSPKHHRRIYQLVM